MTGRNISTSFCWIPSRVDLPPGDQVDLLAKEAASSEESFLTIFTQDLLPLPVSLQLQSWTELWNSATTGNTYELIQPTLPLLPWFDYFSFSIPSHLTKSLISTITRSRLGHNQLHLNFSSPSPCAAHGLTDHPHSLNHLFLSCCKHDHFRKKLYSHLLSLHTLTPIHIFSLLTSNSILTILALFWFRHNTKLIL